MPTKQNASKKLQIPNHAIDATFGAILRQCRLEQGMTQEQLAWVTGVERAFISELERGKKGASIKMLFKLATGLQVEPSKLIVLVEERIRG